MSEIVVFHHALGLTEDVLAFADTLRGHGHQVHAPDVYGGWPHGVPLQVHLTQDDPLALGPDGDLEAARSLESQGATVFLYPGTDHFFDGPASARFTERALEFLTRR